MPAYKKQHYLPVSYLKYFSDDQSNRGRDSWFWRFDGTCSRRVPVASQCFGDYHYSKKHPAETEMMFQPREEKWCEIVDQFNNGVDPSRLDHGDLFLGMVDLCVRNAVHKNQTEDEGIEAYEIRLELFFCRLLLGIVGDAFPAEPTEAVKDHLFKYWRLEVIKAQSGSFFITSDNPSIFITCKTASPGQNPPLQMIIVPLCPTMTAVAFDRREIELWAGQANASDMAKLNDIQVHAAQDCVFKAGQFDENEMKRVRYILDSRKKVVSEVTNEAWRSYLTPLPTDKHFSFMKIKPPLM